MTERKLLLVLALATLYILSGRMAAQGSLPVEPVVALCTEYSDAGDLLRASVSAHAFVLSIARPSGQMVELSGSIPESATTPMPVRLVFPCQIAISPSSDHAALAIPTSSGLFLQLLDLSTGQLGRTVQVPPKYPVQFSWHAVGFLNGSEQLAVSQAHYLPTGEPEVSTQLVGADGAMIPDAHSVTGPTYSEVSVSTLDFRGDRVWFLCPAYSARIDRQPRCTLKSAPLREAASAALEIPPPPDDRVIGSGQPNLGFPSSDVAVVLAQDRFWLYSFSTRSFRQMDLPETPHHIRWSEFPGQPKFSADGRFAAVPVFMFHAPLFEEGQVSHGTKIVVVDMATLQILQTIQPDKQETIVDFALHNDGMNLTLVANWGRDWKISKVPIVQGN
jgi:hypothetical protein